MTRPLLALALAALVTLHTGCGNDAPEATPAPAATEAEARIAEANARAAEANARAAEAAAGGTEAPSTATDPVPTTTAPAPSPSRGSSAPPRPGLGGLTAPTGTTPQLISGSSFFRFCETYDRTTDLSSYRDMELCYTGDIRQEGNVLIGSGTKVTENGRDLTGSARTPIRIEGYLHPDNFLNFNYTVQGARRASRGNAYYAADLMNQGTEGVRWDGGFNTDAANSSGSSFFFISIDSGA